MSDGFAPPMFPMGTPHHTKTELNAVAVAAQAGDERAKAKLGEMVQPYVIRFLRRVGRNPAFAWSDGLGYTPAQRNEMTSEAWAGVWHALDRWDPEAGTKFTTYAHYWQRHYVMEWIAANTRSLKLPRKSWHYGLLLQEAWVKAGYTHAIWDGSSDELRRLEIEVEREGAIVTLKLDGGVSGRGLYAEDIIRALRQPHNLPAIDNDAKRSSQSAEDDFFDEAGDMDADAVFAHDNIVDLLAEGDEDMALTVALDFIETYGLPQSVADQLMEVARCA